MPLDFGETSTSLSYQRTQTALKLHLSYRPKTGMKMVSVMFPDNFVNNLWFLGTGNAMVRYRIVEGDTGGNFSIDSVTGEVSYSENSDWCCLLRLFSVSKAFDMNSNDGSSMSCVDKKKRWKIPTKWSWTIFNRWGQLGPLTMNSSQEGDQRRCSLHLLLLDFTLPKCQRPGVQHDRESVWPGHPLPLLRCQRQSVHPRPERPRSEGLFLLFKTFESSQWFLQFQTHKYWVDIPEDTPGGTPVLQVTLYVYNVISYLFRIFQAPFPNLWKGMKNPPNLMFESIIFILSSASPGWL